MHPDHSDTYSSHPHCYFYLGFCITFARAFIEASPLWRHEITFFVDAYKSLRCIQYTLLERNMLFLLVSRKKSLSCSNRYSIILMFGGKCMTMESNMEDTPSISIMLQGQFALQALNPCNVVGRVQEP